MKFTPSSELVKRSLSGHGWIGLLVGGLLYLVCLTGTMAVFSDEFRRWEQPNVDERPSYSSSSVEKAITEFILNDKLDSQFVTVALPSPTLPRTILYAGDEQGLALDNHAWLVETDGSVGTQVNDEWSTMFLTLHYYLHFPDTFGEIVVSVIGTLLIALIVSGFFSHPLIFRDAFRLRLTGFRRLEQADIHNRLSVWGAPFHLMIAVTGAFFGFAFVILPIGADALHDGDSTAVEESVYGSAPQLQNQTGPLAVAVALDSMKSIAPDATLMRIEVNGVGDPGQYLSISAKRSQRLVYEENYLFDSSGTYLFSHENSDGAIGKQVVMSTYRLHFGYFGGFATKIIWAILGFALTVVSVTGVNVWLARRKTRDYLNCIWSGVVWGAPTALALTAIAQVIFGIPSKGIFWGVLITAISLCVWLGSHRKGEQFLQGVCALALVTLFAAHLLIFGTDALSSAAAGINIAIVSAGAVMGMLAAKNSFDFFSEKIATQP